MAKMHVNPKTKEKGRCKAKSPETCTFNNGEGLHFQTMGEADLWIAEALENEAGGPAGYLQPLKSEAPEVEPDLDALDEDIDLNEPTCASCSEPLSECDCEDCCEYCGYPSLDKHYDDCVNYVAPPKAYSWD